MAQGEQRLLSYFNIDRDIPPNPMGPFSGAAMARDTFVLIAIGLLILIAVIAVTVGFRS